MINSCMYQNLSFQIGYRAVNVSGGCSLEVDIRPVVLFCNASPLTLTLRAYDAAPLCKLEPGTAIAPSSVIVQVRNCIIPFV